MKTAIIATITALLVCALPGGAGAATTSLFNDDFDSDTSALYATGGYVSNPENAGSLTIAGNGAAVFQTNTSGGGSYFGFGRALGANVLAAPGDTLHVSLTFSLGGISTNSRVLALYVA
jgi:hypothetical protein